MENNSRTINSNSEIDIIIPVYNTDKHLLERCVKSILNQNYARFRILLIDDGSEKAYAGFLDTIREQDQRILVFHKNNGGPASARNYGVRAAKAKFIAFVDSDDQITPWFLGEAISCIKEHNLDVVIGGNVFEGRQVNKSSNDIEIVEQEQIESLISSLISSDLITFGTGGYIGRGPWARVVLRELALLCPFDETLHISEDICWNMDVLRKTKCVGIKKNIWYIYTTQSPSLTRSYNPNLMNYVQAGLKSIEIRIDDTNQAQYYSFLKRVKDDINLLNCSYICKLDKKNKRDTKYLIYHSHPWILLENLLFDKSSEKKMKFISLLYRTRLIFPFYSIREKLKKYHSGI